MSDYHENIRHESIRLLHARSLPKGHTSRRAAATNLLRLRKWFPVTLGRLLRKTAKLAETKTTYTFGGYIHLKDK
jgi:hypothetical protein